MDEPEPLVRALLASLEKRMADSELDALFRDVGRRLAADEGQDQAPRRGHTRKSLETRAHEAAQLLTALGAEIDVERTSDGFLLRGHACPLSDSVRMQPRVCHAMTQLVSAATGTAVRECCDRSGGPDGGGGGPIRCCFEVRRSA